MLAFLQTFHSPLLQDIHPDSPAMPGGWFRLNTSPVLVPLSQVPLVAARGPYHEKPKRSFESLQEFQAH